MARAALDPLSPDGGEALVLAFGHTSTAAAAQAIVGMEAGYGPLAWPESPICPSPCRGGL